MQYMDDITELKLTIYRKIGAKGEVIRFKPDQMPQIKAKANKAWYNENAFAVRVEKKVGRKWITVRYDHRN